MALSRRAFLAGLAAVPIIGGTAMASGKRHVKIVPKSTLLVTVQSHIVDGSLFTDDADRTAVLTALDVMGTDGFRFDTGWGSWEPTQGNFVSAQTVHSGRLKIGLDFCQAHGLKAIVTLHECPAWARGGTDPVKTLPTDPTDIGPVAAWMAEQFAAGWPGVVLAEECWNEPDQVGFDSLGPRPGHYAECLKAFYTAVKGSANPSMNVLFGAPSSVAYRTDGSADLKSNWIYHYWNYVDANGLGRNYDWMGVHAYPGPDTPTSSSSGTSTWKLSQLQYLIAAMAARGESTVPIHIGEFGWSDHDNTALPGQTFPVPSFQLGETEATQASYETGALDYVTANFAQVNGMNVYNDRRKGDPDTAATNVDRHEFGYGVLKQRGVADQTDHELYRALAAWLGAR